MKRISEDIKTGQFKHVYLLYGEEAYLIRRYRDMLRQALVADGDTMNVAYFSGKDIRPGELIDFAETMPFFAKRRCVFVDESGFFKKAPDELAEYMERIPETAYFVFTELDEDDRLRQSDKRVKRVDKRLKLFKQIEKYGRAVEFKHQAEKDLMMWILGLLNREGKKITRPVMEQFLTRTGKSMDLISQELEKLFCYTMGREVIEAADIEAICSNRVTDRIFQMVEAIAEKRQKQALDLYYDLLMLKEPPRLILSQINRQFQSLMQIKEMLNQGVDRMSMAKKAKVPEFAVNKYIGQARKFTSEQLAAAVRDGVQADENIKTGRMNKQLAVELLIMSYS